MPIPFMRENMRLIGMALRQFPTITGEGGRVSSRNRDLGTNGDTMDREIEAVDRSRQILLASKEILHYYRYHVKTMDPDHPNFIRLLKLTRVIYSQNNIGNCIVFLTSARS